MEYKVKLQLPPLQNFIVIDIPTNIEMAKLNQSVTPKPSIAIEKLTQEQAEEYAEELKQQFLSHYKHKKEQITNQYGFLDSRSYFPRNI